MNLTTSQLTKIGVGLGLCYGLYKFSSNAALKTGAIAVGAVIVARQVPYVGAALAM